MKKLLQIIVILLILVSHIAATEISDPNVRDAQHLILPFLGYQILDGEQLGYSFSTVIPSELWGDTTISASGTYTHDTKTPVLGITYRYRPIPNFFTELSIASFLDGQSFTYPAEYSYRGYSQIVDITVSRSNTAFVGLDVVGVIPIPLKWFSVNGRVGGGYAWRDVKVKLDEQYAALASSVESIDAKRMYLVRGGLDFSLWKSNLLMLQGSITYSQFIPTDSDLDSFGGLGWQISIFPIWSGR
ncbi:MAG: hypothetical protein P9M15_06670 [Candidatus Electryoneaceae bacterium]|nr:hypothetical protein [Candidatus Electryoneaceae bacterium]